ncbi:hypothetical protein B9Z65_7895 [Elsinoe australis]|uniref:Flavin reductase like domain-containing protein n=1 Tax=Elsinoe australis TaxID=40998 RepID=A0A2P8A0U3_9PEZI|nr:hypothetical protein B9Z65_7895 [Elsinoe australis]
MLDAEGFQEKISQDGATVALDALSDFETTLDEPSSQKPEKLRRAEQDNQTTTTGETHEQSIPKQNKDEKLDVLEVGTSLRVPKEIAHLFPREGSLPKAFRSSSTTATIIRSARAATQGDEWIRIEGKPASVQSMVRRLTMLSEKQKPSLFQQKEEALGRNEEPAQSPLLEPFKLLMRSVVNPVAVVTTRKSVEMADVKEYFGGCRGSTISSFMSVTTKPAPVISFNLLTESRTAKKMEEGGFCDVHILADDAHGLDVAQKFAAAKGLSAGEPFRKVRSSKAHNVEVTSEGVVVITGPGVLARLRCRLMPDKVVRIGDHKIMFCEVIDILKGPTEVNPRWTSLAEPLERTCLAYANHNYGAMSITHELTLETGGGDVKRGHKQDKKESQPIGSQSAVGKEAEVGESDMDYTEASSNLESGLLAQDSIHGEQAQPSSLAKDKSMTEKESAKASLQDIIRQATLFQSKQKNSGSAKAEKPIRSKEVDRAHARIKAQTDSMLDDILNEEEKAYLKEQQSSKPRPGTPNQPAQNRQFSSTASLDSQRRAYATKSQPALDSEEDSAFLKQTAREFLGYDTIPGGRWVNDRWIRELQDYGPERVQIAIRGGQPDAPDDASAGGKRNRDGLRIRKLIEHLHRAQKQGHIKDSVMEELVLGKGHGEGSGRR